MLTDRIDVILLVLTLFLVYWMLTCLVSISARLRLPKAALPTRQSDLVQTKTRSIPLAGYRSKSTVMFKNAVEAYGNGVKPQNDLRHAFGSSASQNNRSQSQHTPDRQTPLQTTQPSLLNRANGSGSSLNSGVKRMSNGLAKAAGADKDPFYQTSIAAPMPGQHDKNSVVFEEDDFDSDVDIDVEIPKAKAAISYPKLPPNSRQSPATKYPSISRAGLHSHNSPDPAYKSTPAAQFEASPSSEPLPWSSSPDDHKSRSTRPPVDRPPLARFAYTAPDDSRPEADKGPSAPSIERSDPVTRPTKRRTLPWLTESSQSRNDESPVSRITSSKNSAQRPSAPNVAPNVTPAAKESGRSLYPWNTTASAFKEQQKQLRKANKKPTKSEEGTEEKRAPGVTSRKNVAIARPALSSEQRHVLDLVVNDQKSVFFTGSAGTGKSVLLREIISVLRKKYQREIDRIAITASTGLAACNIGGVTLHSFAGIGLGKEDVPELVKKIKRNQKAKHRWMRTKVLVIDEVSMVDGGLFDKLEEIARRIRNNGRPFGGIQLVVTGDFFQLPPVPDNGGRDAKFSFDASTWKTAIDHTIGLNHVFRQKDAAFASMLNEMREGRLSTNSSNAFRKLSRPLQYMDDLQATELFPTRGEVDMANRGRMHQLMGDSSVFHARDGGTIVDKQQRDRLLGNCMAPEVLELKKGAQVMLIKNIDEMLVNGSLGKVVGFMNEATFENYNADPENYLSTQQAPDSDLNPAELKQKKTQQALAANTAQVWPVVRFSLADGTSRDMLCNREQWKIELPNGEVQASRSQIPLILAWALSIHKAQGQTLERVKVDLGKVFEKGQAYVALSRATSMAGLQVLRFAPEKVMAHPRVREFYEGLSRVGGLGEKGAGAGDEFDW